MKVITKLQDLGDLINSLSISDTVYFDTETSGLDTLTCMLYTMQIRTGAETYIVDCLKFPDVEVILNLIKNKLIVGHNLNYDIKVIYNNTGIVFTNVFDTQSAEILMNKGLGKNFYSLAELVEEYCGVTLDKEVRNTFFENGLVTELTQEQLIYAALDVEHLEKIMWNQRIALNNLGLAKTFYDIEMKVLPVTAVMEATGVPIDTVKWKGLMVEAEQQLVIKHKALLDNISDRIDFAQYSNTVFKSCFSMCLDFGIPAKTQKLCKELELITNEVQIKQYFIDNINLNSHSQLLKILNHLGIKTESTGEKVLKELNSKDPIIKMILDYREFEKKVASFGSSFLEKVHPTTHRIHCNLNPLITNSGRYSADNPNLQQIVRDSEYRHCFKPESDDWLVITADYSQQELRLAGAVTNEPKFISAFKNGVDMHTLTASIIYNKDVSEIAKDSPERSKAKSLNFAILYGSSVGGLEYNFGFTKEESQLFYDRFTQGYPVLAQFKTEFENACIEHDYAVTVNGRKRFFGLKGRMWADEKEYIAEVKKVKRQAFNHLVQGTGGDICKLALCKIFYENPFGKLLKLILTVHDEIVLEVHSSVADEAAKFVKKCMEEVEALYLGSIPAIADVKVDKYWSK